MAFFVVPLRAWLSLFQLVLTTSFFVMTPDA